MPTPLLDNRQLGFDIGRANLLTNGGMRVAQRTGWASPGYGAFGPDRWQFYPNGSSTFTGVSTGIMGGGAFMAINGTFTYNAGDGSVQQIIRLADDNQYSLRNRPVSLSAQVYVTTAGATRIFIATDGTGGAYNWSTLLTTANQYVTLTVPNIVVPIDATYILAGLYMQGSTQFWFTEAMLVQGAQPCMYQPLTPADDWSRCLRYYQRWQSGAANQDIATGQAYSTTSFIVMVPYQGPLGGASPSPVLTYSALADWGVSDGGFGQYIACASIGVRSWNNGRGMFNIQGTVASGLTLGYATTMGSRNTNAWLAVEWNP